MRELTVSFTNDGKAVIGDVLNFQDEHRAVCLAVTLSSDLTAVEPDEYYLSFVRDADLDNPMPQKLLAGPVQDIREGVLYYELPSALTASTCLAVQLEAVRKDANGAVDAVVKSPPFLLRFSASLQGEDALPVTADANELLARLLDVQTQTVQLNQTLTDALDQGLFLARINGHNAVTLQGGRNLTLTDHDGTLTIDCSALPIVTALPPDPQEGETVLLIPQNTVTLRESGRELATGAGLLAAAAASEMQLLAQQPESRCPFYFNLRKAGALVGFVSMTSDPEEGDEGEVNAVSIFSFVTKMRNDQALNGYAITFVNGVFSAERSSVLSSGRAAELNVIPSAVRLPEFDAVEVVSQQPLQAPVFFGSTALMAYRGRWIDITSLAADKHFHGNLATLDGFLCDASEAAANTPEGQPVIALDYTGWNRLRWGGSEVRMVDDGGVIDRVETVAVNGKSFLRLWMDYGEVSAFSTGAAHPAFIDIPVDSAAAAVATQGGVTVNGTSLDLGVNSLEQQVDAILPDWSENDANDRGYIANRTHWREVSSRKTDITFVMDSGLWYESSEQTNHNFGSFSYPLVEGKSYVITYNGQDHEFVAQLAYHVEAGSYLGSSPVTMTRTAIGNMDLARFELFGEHPNDYTPSANDFPFCLIYETCTEQGQTDLYTMFDMTTPYSSVPDGTQVSFSIAEVDYHTLSEKYLPDGLTDAIEHEHVHAAETHASSFSGRLQANCFTRVGSSASPASSVTVTGFDSAGSGLMSEYLLKFHSGSTPTTLTLPASVVWAEELTVESDKIYEISILDDLAVWCAFDEEAGA